MPDVTVAWRGSYGPGNTRYRLSNHWFIDREEHTARRHLGHKYSLWEPGAGQGGIAAYRGGAPRLADVLTLANEYQQRSAAR